MEEYVVNKFSEQKLCYHIKLIIGTRIRINVFWAT